MSGGGRRAGALLFLAAVAVLVAVPALVGGPRGGGVRGARRLIVMTPHNEQIREEFSRAFDQWHRRVHGEPARIVWTVPGGTAEIMRMLEAQFAAALRAGDPPGGSADLLMGGGSWVHTQLARPIETKAGGRTPSTTISVPAGLDPAWLEGVYGENRIADRPLYDPAQHWLGLAVSSFGIVYNRDAFQALRLPEPEGWEDLCAAELRRRVAMVNPAQSGSIASLYETILAQRGWTDGWRILRRAGANSRSFSGGAPRAPIDVSLGQAAAGICIDFFGRSQAQAIGGERLGYVDPPGETLFDPDPISLLRGAPDPELARRFIVFCLATEGQALWQFRAGPDGPGPQRHELRRMPIVRSVYRDHMERFVDRIDPWALARPPRHPDPGVRELVTPLFSAMVIDTHDLLRRAWDAIVDHPAYPGGRGVVSGADVADPALARMLELFDQMPEAPASGGSTVPLRDPAGVGPAAAALNDAALWPADGEPVEILRVRFACFFAANYRRILVLRDGGTASP
jgi:ABC-type Fe3+ transport system substrate-binding protein